MSECSPGTHIFGKWDLWMLAGKSFFVRVCLLCGHKEHTDEL
jgi:hypothetical protein